MNRTEFEEAGSLKKPGPIGRWLRILSGVLCFYFLYMVGRGYSGIVSTEFPAAITLWLGVLFCLYGIPHVLNIGFGLNWGKWPRWVFVVIAVVAVAFSYFQNRTLWGPEVGLMIFSLLVFVLATLAPSFVLSGMIATPGCSCAGQCGGRTRRNRRSNRSIPGVAPHAAG